MLHVPPSAVVKHIERVFPWIRGSDQRRSGANGAGEMLPSLLLSKPFPHLLFAPFGAIRAIVFGWLPVGSWVCQQVALPDPFAAERPTGTRSQHQPDGPIRLRAFP